MGTLTKEEIKVLDKNAKEDSIKIKDFIYKMNGGPHPLRPFKEK